MFAFEDELFFRQPGFKLLDSPANHLREGRYHGRHALFLAVRRKRQVEGVVAAGLGERVELGRHTFAADGIKAFASRFDPQPFHLDEAAAARSHFGALCASGWHTAAIWMRLMVEHQRRDDAVRRERGEPLAELGPSPGFRELKWLKPVFVGDTIDYAMEIVETRPSNSRPGWGLITLRNSGANQRGELVISFVSVAFVQRRAAAAMGRS